MNYNDELDEFVEISNYGKILTALSNLSSSGEEISLEEVCRSDFLPD